MKRFVFLLTLVVCLALATGAYAAPRPDKATGSVMFDTGEYFSFAVFEAVGVPGEPGYRPMKGSVTTVGCWTCPDGTYPIDSVYISSDTNFGFGWLGYISTAGWYDGGEPGWKFDGYWAGAVTSGNIQVHNYPDDGD